MKTLIIILLSLVMLCSFSNVTGQPFLQWQTFGFYTGSVECILDLDSAILAGADGGLSCINKSTLQITYLNGNNSGIIGSKIYALEKDSNNSVWIGTNCGLVKWQGNNWIQYTPQNSILTSGVSALRYSPWQHALYAGCMDGKVIKIDTSGWSFVTGINITSPIFHISDIEVGQNGYIWAVISKYYPGIYKYDGNDWSLFNLSNTPLLYSNPVSLDIDSAGILWVVTSYNLLSYDGNQWTNHGSVPIGCINLYVSCEENNDIWMSSSCGIRIFDGNSTTPHPINQLLPYLYINSHLKGKNGELWLGRFMGGMFHVTNQTIAQFFLTPEMEAPSINDIAFDKVNSKVWLATGIEGYKPASACWFNDTVWHNFNIQNSPISNATSTAVIVDNNSTVFLGTFNEGLWVLQNNSWTNYNTTNSNIVHDAITALAIDSSNQLLIGFNIGMVQTMSGGNFITLFQDTAIKYQIHRILPQNSSTFWIATHSSGLVRFNYSSGYFIYDTANSGIPTNKIRDLQIDHLNRIWIATYDSGVVMYDGLNWTVYNTLNSGLPERHVTSLTFAPDSSLWIGLAHLGIAVMKNNLWTHYTTCNSPLASAWGIKKLRTGPDGRIYIGTWGLNIVYCDNITEMQKTDPPAFEFCAIPNPASGIVTFEFRSTALALPGYLEIYSLLGNNVFTTSVSPEAESIQCDISGFNRGIYFAVLKSGKDQVRTARFVVY